MLEDRVIDDVDFGETSKTDLFNLGVVYPVVAYQNGKDPVLAYAFLGAPSERYIRRAGPGSGLKGDYGLSEYQGVVFVSEGFVKGVDVQSLTDKNIIVENPKTDFCYGIKGHLPSPELRKKLQERIGLLEGDEIVFVLRKDMPGLCLGLRSAA